MVQRIELKWLGIREAIAIHGRQIAEHGGGMGIRSRELLESALARPVNRWAYGEDALSSLAAAYAFGIARNHPFVDGNKRIAWILARLFLAYNDHDLTYGSADAVRVMLDLAAGDLSEEQMAEWFEARLMKSN